MSGLPGSGGKEILEELELGAVGNVTGPGPEGLELGVFPRGFWTQSKGRDWTAEAPQAPSPSIWWSQ